MTLLRLDHSEYNLQSYETAMSTSTFKRLSKAIFLIPLAILVLERVAWTVNYDDLVSSAVKAGAEAFNAPPPPENLRGGGGVERLAEEIESGGAQASSRRDLQRRIPLDELAGEQQACADTFVAVPDKHLPYEELFSGNRKIPRIVHQTARSRCVTMKFLGVVDNWCLGDDWAHYFHSDDAIDRLFQQDWPEFPHLRTVLACIDGKGTLKADLWRYLVLWEYGGIYADVDTKPNKFNATTITAEDDGFFIVEQYHILSQYFMATTPRHRKC
jgi:mannosyltransferase OCH1-like enzyme